MAGMSEFEKAIVGEVKAGFAKVAAAIRENGDAIANLCQVLESEGEVNRGEMRRTSDELYRVANK